jgi:ferredoxin
MSVNVTIQDNQWNNIWTFQAEDKKSFTTMAKEHNITIQTACDVWSCGICKCKIVDWYYFVQIDKISKPLWELEKDENGMITTIFTCIAGVKSEYLNDGKDNKIILRRLV